MDTRSTVWHRPGGTRSSQLPPPPYGQATPHWGLLPPCRPRCGAGGGCGGVLVGGLFGCCIAWGDPEVRGGRWGRAGGGFSQGGHHHLHPPPHLTSPKTPHGCGHLHHHAAHQPPTPKKIKNRGAGKLWGALIRHGASDGGLVRGSVPKGGVCPRWGHVPVGCRLRGGASRREQPCGELHKLPSGRRAQPGRTPWPRARCYSRLAKPPQSCWPGPIPQGNVWGPPRGVKIGVRLRGALSCWGGAVGMQGGRVPGSVWGWFCPRRGGPG